MVLMLLHFIWWRVIRGDCTKYSAFDVHDAFVHGNFAKRVAFNVGEIAWNSWTKGSAFEVQVGFAKGSFAISVTLGVKCVCMCDDKEWKNTGPFTRSSHQFALWNRGHRFDWYKEILEDCSKFIHFDCDITIMVDDRMLTIAPYVWGCFSLSESWLSLPMSKAVFP